MGEGEKPEGAGGAEGQVVGELVGKVVGYFAKIGVAAVVAEGDIKVGDTLHFKGHTTDFEMTVVSMHVNDKPAESAKAGDEVGIKVPDRVREHDKVLRK
jgi:putative protease